MLVVSARKSEVARIRKTLETSGYDFVPKQVTTFTGFVKAVSEEAPDLVICDYRFPGFDSVEALRYMKTRGIHIPLLVVSDSSSREIESKCLREGAAAFVEKADKMELVKATTAALQNSHRRNSNHGEDYSEFYKIFLDAETRAGTGFAVLDGISGRPLYVNRAFCELTGYAASEILRLTTMGALFIRKDVDKFETKIASLDGRLNNVLKFTSGVTTSSGRTALLEFTAAKLGDAGNSKIAMFTKKVQQKKRKSTSKFGTPVTCEMCDYGVGFKSLVEDVKDYGLFTLDEEGKIKSWNAGVRRLLGYRDTEIIGSDLADLLAVGSEEGLRLVSFLGGLERAGRMELETWLLRKNQERLWAGLTLTTLFDPDGIKRGYSVVLKDLGPRKLAEDQLKESEAQLHSLAAHLQSAREEERANIARLLHDEFGQMLTALRMDLSVLGRMVSRTVGESLSRMSLLEKISSISEILEKTIRSTRKIITDLRPAVLDELGLLTAIQWQVLEFENRTGIHCTIKRLQHDITLDANASTMMFRILQETLNNVMRHSGATRVSISMQVVDSNIVLEISDNGRGIEPDKLKDPTSTGIIGMRERVLSLGGELKVRGESGKGTTLKALIPYSRNRAA